MSAAPGVRPYNPTGSAKVPPFVGQGFGAMSAPLWKRGGCHLDRETLSLVREAGFGLERVGLQPGSLVLTVFARDPRGETAAPRSTANGQVRP